LTKADDNVDHHFDHDAVPIELTAVVVAVTGEEPLVLTIQNAEALPTGPFMSAHRTLQSGLRSWVERQTHHPLGYIEQLYTFADRDRTHGGVGERLVSISYLGLTRQSHPSGERDPRWQSWYHFLPWEDWRSGPPALVARVIAPRLRAWAKGANDLATPRERKNRIEIAFGLSGGSWNEEFTLQRYELLYEAGLVPEAKRRHPVADPLPGAPMRHDHRRILATGVARLRAKIKYRPVVFELMPANFTLHQLQRVVEALAGRQLHKQNFRRLIDQQGLVEDTGKISMQTGGRPAKLVRFRREVLLERAVAGTKLPLTRPA
jgi:hypothetical protein